MTDPMLLGLPAILVIFITSVVLSLFVSLAYKYLTDQSLMREYRKELKKLHQQMKENKTNIEKLNEIHKQAMEINMKLLKQTIKPMFATVPPFFIIFGIFKKVYNGLIVLPVPFWEGHLGWLGTYLIFSLIFTMIFRKALKVV